MDPVTILGAVGSVVGIAAFGLQLSSFLDTFVSAYVNQGIDLDRVSEIVEGTHEALDAVLGLLVEEKDNLERYKKYMIFSERALGKVESTAHKCLKTFWMIEATVAQKGKKDLDAELATKLREFIIGIKEAKVDVLREAPHLLQLKGHKLKKIQRLRWFSSLRPQLERFCDQLDQHKSTLTLLISVVMLRGQMIDRSRQNVENISIDPQLRREMADMAKQLQLAPAKPSPPDYSTLPPDPSNSRKETIVGSWPKTSKSNKSNASRSTAGKLPSSRRRRKDTQEFSSHRRRRSQSQDSASVGDPIISRGRTPEPNTSFSGLRDRQDYHPKSRHKKRRPLGTKESDMSSGASDNTPKYMKQVNAAQQEIARTKLKGKRPAKASDDDVVGKTETKLPKGGKSSTKHIFPDIPLSQSPAPGVENDTQSMAPERKPPRNAPVKTTREKAGSVPTPSRSRSNYQKASVTEPLESPKENPESEPNLEAHDLQRKFDVEVEELLDSQASLTVELVQAPQEDPTLEARPIRLTYTPLSQHLPRHEQDISPPSLSAAIITKKPPQKLEPSDIYANKPLLKLPTTSIVSTSTGLNIKKDSLTSTDVNESKSKSNDKELSIFLPPPALSQVEVPMGKGEPLIERNSLTLIPSHATKIKENTEDEDSDVDSFITASGYWTPLEDLAKELDILELAEEVRAVARDAEEEPLGEQSNTVLIDLNPGPILAAKGIDVLATFLPSKSKEQMKNVSEFTEERSSKAQSNTIATEIGHAVEPVDNGWKNSGTVERKMMKKKNNIENTMNNVAEEVAVIEERTEIKRGAKGPPDPVDYVWGTFETSKPKEKNKPPDDGIVKGPKKESSEGSPQPADDDDLELCGAITKKKEKKGILGQGTVEETQKYISLENGDTPEGIEDTRHLGAAKIKKKTKKSNVIIKSPSKVKLGSQSPSSVIDPRETATLISEANLKRTPVDEDIGVDQVPQASGAQVPSLEATQIYTSLVEIPSESCLQQSPAVVPAQISSNVRSNTPTSEQVVVQNTAPLPPTFPPPSRFVNVFEFMDCPKVEEMPLAHDNASSTSVMVLSDHITAASATSYGTARTSSTWTRHSYSTSTSRTRAMMIDALKRITRQDYIGPNDLEDMFGSGSLVTAFVIRGAEYHQIPCTGHFALRKSNFENLNTSGSISWKDFAFLSFEEISSLTKITENDDGFNKSLVRLKWLRKSRMKFWSSERRALVAMIHNDPISSFGSENSNSLQQERAPFGMTRNAKAANRKITSAVEDRPSDQPSDQATSRRTKEAVDEMSRNFVIYVAYTVRVFASAITFEDPASVLPSTTKEGFSEGDIMQRISKLNATGMQTIDKKLKLLDVQQEVIIKIIDGLNKSQVEPGFVWNLAQLEEIAGQSIGSRAVTIYLRKKSTAETMIDAPTEVIPPQKKQNTKSGMIDDATAAIKESASSGELTKPLAEEDECGSWDTASNKDKMKGGKIIAVEETAKEQSSQRKNSPPSEGPLPPNESSSLTNSRIVDPECELAIMRERVAQAEIYRKKDQASQAQETTLPTLDTKKKAAAEEMTKQKQQKSRGQTRKPSPWRKSSPSPSSVLSLDGAIPEPASYLRYPQPEQGGYGYFPNAQYPYSPPFPQSYAPGGYPTSTQTYSPGYPYSQAYPSEGYAPLTAEDEGRMMAADPNSLASRFPPNSFSSPASYGLGTMDERSRNASSYADYDNYRSGEKRRKGYYQGVPPSVSTPYRQAPSIVPQPPKEARFPDNPVVSPKLTKENIAAKMGRNSILKSPSPSWSLQSNRNSQAPESRTVPRTHGSGFADKITLSQDSNPIRSLSSRFGPPISQPAYSSRGSQGPLPAGRSDPYIGPDAFGRRTAAQQYPENYDSRPFNLNATPMEIEEETDIVRGLLLGWTPEGDERKAKYESRTRIDLSDASRPENVSDDEYEDDDGSSDFGASQQLLRGTTSVLHRSGGNGEGPSMRPPIKGTWRAARKKGKGTDRTRSGRIKTEYFDGNYF